CLTAVPLSAEGECRRSTTQSASWGWAEAMSRMPEPVAELVDALAAIPGTVAVVLGGSHALETSDKESDWDLGLYYRGAIDLTSLAERGTRSEEHTSELQSRLHLV